MAYLPLNNYKYDSGPHRIQSGPAHEGYIVLSSGVQSLGADNGVIIDGPPLSGTIGSGQKWSYNNNWRYVPTAPVNDPNSPYYNLSGYLDTTEYTTLASPVTIAGAKISTSTLSESTYTNLNYKRSVYYGGFAPDNQNYDPFNTPEFNSAAEGTTGGGTTHRVYENPLLINSLGSQGTASRRNWDYYSPTYCSTYTETSRSTKPGQMSSTVRSIYRGSSSSYSLNYGYSVLGNAGSFDGGEEVAYPPDEGPFSPNLYLSRIYSPISNIDVTDPNQTGQPQGAGATFVDSEGNSYIVWTYRRDPSTFSAAFSAITITKRDIIGDIIWVKQLNGVVNQSSIVNFVYCEIIDVNDGFGESLVFFFTRAINLNQAGFIDYRTTFLSVNLESGSINKEYWFSGPGGYLGSPKGAWPTTVVSYSYIPSLNEYYIVSADYIFRFDPRTGAWKGGYYLFTNGGYIAPYYPDDQTVLDFGNGKTLVLLSINDSNYRLVPAPGIGQRGLCVIPHTNGVPDSNNWKIYTGTGGNVSAVYYDGYVLAVTAVYIYVLDQSGNVFKRINLPHTAVGKVAVKLEPENNKIYLWGNWVDGGINGRAMLIILTYDLTKVVSIIRVNVGQNNIYFTHGTTTGGYNIAGDPIDTLVMYMDTMAPYGQSAAGGRALVMIASFKPSIVGQVSLPAGGFTATVSGTPDNRDLNDSVASAGSVVVGSGVVIYPLAPAPIWDYPTTPQNPAPYNTIWTAPTQSVDNTNFWLYNLYSTDL